MILHNPFCACTCVCAHECIRHTANLNLLQSWLHWWANGPFNAANPTTAGHLSDLSSFSSNTLLVSKNFWHLQPRSLKQGAFLWLLPFILQGEKRDPSLSRLYQAEGILCPCILILEVNSMEEKFFLAAEIPFSSICLFPQKCLLPLPSWWHSCASLERGNMVQSPSPNAWA